MRQAGSLSSERDARRLVDYLLTAGISAKAEGAGEAWAIWIIDEKDLARAKQELEQFRAAPDDPRYAQAERAAESLRRDQAAAARERGKQVVELRDRWIGYGRLAAHGRLTIVLIGLCMAVALLTRLGTEPSEIGDSLLISSTREPIGQSPSWEGLEEIHEGEIWRLVTPIFLHFGVLHLIFNSYWLLGIGGPMEARLGTLRFGLLVLVSAIVSNLAQYFWQGPGFGGMSGVLYALFGFAWMKSRFDPHFGLRLDPGTVFMMLLWLVICAFSDGQVANMAHGSGLAVGVILGLATTFLRR